MKAARQSALGGARGWPSDFSVRRQSESALRALLDEVDGARLGLIAVGLRHAHMDRKIRPFREADRVDERDVSGPVVFRQAVDAQPSTKTAAFGLNEVVPQRRELDLARNDIRFEAKRASGRVVEPEIDAGEVAGCHRAPGKGRAGLRLLHLALGIEEIHRGEGRTPWRPRFTNELDQRASRGSPCGAARQGPAQVLSLATAATYGKMLLITGSLCCLDHTTDPRGTKPSVVCYLANLVTRYLLAGVAFPSRRASATAGGCGLAAATGVTVQPGTDAGGWGRLPWL